LSSGVEDLRACVLAKGGHFEHSLWTYWLCVDFVNHLSLLCNCVMLCLNIRSRSKQRCCNVHIHTSVSFTR